ncbi:MAG TPA: exopolysaccharide biosynthesis protein [Xanthomonadaceae bacterium]|nr:exopolysaccharide biosynthesis protein [Xanthomonadaceae bacterium]
MEAAIESLPPRTSTLLADLANGSDDDRVRLERLLAGFGRGGFGALLLAVTLPTFIPLPVGVGAVTGPLAALVGLQLVLSRSQPWLPQFLRRKGLRREAFARFLARVQPWLRRLERLVRPRLHAMTGTIPANLVTGVLLIALGVLLALPIPFTNYPLGLLMLLFAIALIERDGVLMAINWTLAVGTIIGFGLLSGQAMAWFNGAG